MCKGCGSPLPAMTRRGNPRIWCSEACRVRAYYKRVGPPPRDLCCRVFVKDCRVCGAVYIARGSSSVACGDSCRRRYNAERTRRAYWSDPDGAARRVQKSRAARTPEQIKRERERARRWSAQAGYHESKRAADQRRRAAKLAVEVEKFSTTEIYERDAWRCGICRRKVRESLAWPHPMSASLDHVVPLSQLGPHTRANVRLAHLSCNTARSNRGGGEQLALLG